MNDNDILDSVGGSLLNDLLSDLNAAVAADGARSDGDDDLFGLLERELTSTYGDVGDHHLPLSAAALPPGSMLSRGGSISSSSAAFVVDRQARQSSSSGGVAPPATPPAAPGGGGGGDDAWSAALSQFGSMNMSLASDFLAADTASKKQEVQVPVENHPSTALDPAGGGTMNITSNVVNKLFEDDEDYALEEEVVKFDAKAGAQNNDDGRMGGLLKLLGAASAGGGANESRPKAEAGTFPGDIGQLPPPSNHNNTMALLPGPGTVPNHPLPPGTFYAPPPPPSTGYLVGVPHQQPPGTMARGAMPPHPQNPPNPMAMNPAVPMNNPPQPGMSRPPARLPGVMAHPPTRPSHPPTRPSGAGHHSGREGEILDDREFPALGDRPPKDGAAVDGRRREEPVLRGAPLPRVPIPPADVPRRIFDDADPDAPPVDARDFASKFMPPRDLCYIVHSMLRALQSLDAYNDDFYHWSIINRKGSGLPGLSMVRENGGGVGRTPTPVWKEVKVVARERDEQFLENTRARAKTYAEERKSLGQLVKTNVKRPKALLTTPVLNKDDIVDEGESARDAGEADSRYESEQRRARVRLWRARVSIDRGHAAFLSLIELRRLIQAHASAPRLVGELTADVRTNVDLLHSSLGLSIHSEPGGGKRIDVDDGVLADALSLPKGRALCARAVEEGILPHPSACRVLPAALGCVLSRPTPAEGEDRLLRALTGLVLTPRPAMDPAALRQCLEGAIALAAGEGASEGPSAIAGSHMRMKLLHSVLSVGKEICADDPRTGEDWREKEKRFLEILAQGK